MDFYQVLEKRRTIRDFSDKEGDGRSIGKGVVGCIQSSDQ